MAEGPGPKKPKKKPQAQQKASAPPMPDSIQSSDEENEQYSNAMRGITPAGDTTGASSAGVESGSSSTAPTAGEPAPPHPVQGFWDRLVHGVNGTSRVKEIGRSMARGIGNFDEEVSGLAEKVGSKVDPVGPIGAGLRALGSFHSSLSKENIDQTFGKRSDDPIANFAEGATQFAAGWTVLPEFKILEGAGTAARLVNAMAKGAVVDATAFDPYEAQLAELIAQAPVPGVRQLGEALSVKGDDNEIVARAKRAAAGVISGVVMEGLISSVRLVRNVRAAASANISDAGRELALEEARKEAEKVSAVSKGSHVAEGDHVTVEPAGGGKWTLKSLIEDPSAEMSSRNAAKDATVEAQKAAQPKPQGAPLDPEALKETQPLFDTLKDPNASPEAKAAAQAKIDELGAKGSTPYPEFERGNPPEEVKQRMGLADAPSPVFTDRGEAEAQAATMNGGLQDRATAGKVDAPLAEATANNVTEFAKSRSPEALAQLTDGGPRLGLSFSSETEKTSEIIGRLSNKIADKVQGLVKEQGSVHVEQSFKIAKDAMGSIPLTEAPNVLRTKLGDTLGQHVWELMGNATLKDWGERLAQMSDVLDSRPHDVVAHQEASRMLSAYIDLQATLADHDSEIGRTLRIMQERENPLMDNVKAGESTPAETVDVPKATAAKKAVAEAKKALADEAKIGPNTETVADAADLQKKPSEGAAKKAPIEKQGLNDGTRDTEGVTASDFQQSRARQKALNALNAAREILGVPMDEAVIADNRSLRGERVKMQADAQRANPLEAPDAEALKGPQNPIENLSKLLDQAEADLDRKLEAARKAPEPKKQGQKLPEEVSPVDTHIAETKRLKSIGEPLIAGMNQREIRAALRMVKMSGGAPRNAFAVVYGAQTLKNTGMAAKAMEVFVNALLSGAQTAQTVFASGFGLSTFEPAVRAMAGAVTANRALMREGADIMYGNFKYLWDNIQVAAASARAGRSIINPAPQHIAIGGLTGEAVRIPSKILTGLDELTRVTNYRSYVRAKALRYGRELGMNGPALEQYAEDTLRASFDPATGIATIPDALKYAEVPTLSGPLGPGLGKAMQNFTRDAWQGKLIVPFVKASAKVFDYVWQATPGLNLFNKEAREIIRQGGEQAAILHTRSAVAGSLYGYGLHLALGDRLTGRGPSDPELRKEWLKNKQEYSIKVGDTWVSYRRTDPMGMPLGLIADAKTVIQELGDKHTDTSDFVYGVVASLVSNMANKTYLSGLMQFADAWGKGDVPAVKRWFYRQVSSVAVPQGVAQFNPDDTYREVRGMGDAILSRLPGWSKDLDPRFNIFGEPEMKAPGMLNRSFNMFTTRPVTHSVEDDLLQIRQGLAPMPQKLLGGRVDLSDKVSFDNGTGKSPWLRIMELVRHPDDGRPPLREAMEELVKSDKWKEGSSGSSMFPGGDRWLRAAALKDSYEQRALKQALDEYPKLRNQWQGVQRERGAAIRSGDTGVAEVERLFGLQK